MHQGKVKWFNNAKGYGFIVEDGQTEDLFAHFSSIQMDGYKTLKAGQAVTFDKQPSGKGIHAVNICSAETAESKAAEECIHDEVISVEEEAPMLQPQAVNTTSTEHEFKSTAQLAV